MNAKGWLNDIQVWIRHNMKRVLAGAMVVACMVICATLAFAQRKVDWTVGLVFPLTAAISLISLFLMHVEFDPVSKRFLIKMSQIQEDVYVKKETVTRLTFKLTQLVALRAFFEGRLWGPEELQFREQGTAAILAEIVEMLKAEIPAARKLDDYLHANNMPWQETIQKIAKDLGVPYTPPEVPVKKDQ